MSGNKMSTSLCLIYDNVVVDNWKYKTKIRLRTIRVKIVL